SGAGSSDGSAATGASTASRESANSAGGTRTASASGCSSVPQPVATSPARSRNVIALMPASYPPGGAPFLPRGSAVAADVFDGFHADEHLARPRAVRRPEHTGMVELVDDAGGATVPDPQPSLEQRRRALLELDAGL